MSAPSKKRSGVGFRHARLFALNAEGYIAGVSDTAYEGIAVEGAKTLTITDPEYRRISHTGDDRLLQFDQLPALEGMTAELRVGRLNDDFDALVSGLTAFTVGEANLLLGGVTSESGNEPSLAMLAYRQAQDESGNRVWDARIFPRVVIAKREQGFDDNPEERAYSLTPQLCTKHVWGTAFSDGIEGATQAQVVRGVFQYKPKLIAFQGDGSEDTFPFPADAQAVAVGKIAVWVNGVLRTTNITKATTGLTFTASYEPANLANITVLYETA